MEKRNIKTYNRYFHLILYDDDKEQMEAMEYIITNYKYARIYHDRDIIKPSKNEEREIEEQEFKKQHYHVVIQIGKNPRNRKSIAKELNIKENYIEGCNKDNMLLYLIHYKNPEKTQYDIEEVDGELQEDLIKLINSKCNTQQEKLERILEKIEDGNYTLAEIVKYAIKNNYYTVLKQNQYLIQRLIEERKNKNGRIH